MTPTEALGWAPICSASLAYNPLHLDDDSMKGNFGKTNCGGIVMHGMNNFVLISRMLTDWAYWAGGLRGPPCTGSGYLGWRSACLLLPTADIYPASCPPLSARAPN